MNRSFPIRTRKAGLLAGALAILLTLSGPAASAHEEGVEAIEAYLHGLAEDGAITEAQHRAIEEQFFKGHFAQLENWLEAQARARQISEDTHLYLKALLGLGEPDLVAAAVPAKHGQQRLDARLPDLRPAPESFRSAVDRGLERQRARLS